MWTDDRSELDGTNAAAMMEAPSTTRRLSKNVKKEMEPMVLVLLQLTRRLTAEREGESVALRPELLL